MSCIWSENLAFSGKFRNYRSNRANIRQTVQFTRIWLKETVQCSANFSDWILFSLKQSNWTLCREIIIDWTVKEMVSMNLISFNQLNHYRSAFFLLIAWIFCHGTEKDRGSLCRTHWDENQKYVSFKMKCNQQLTTRICSNTNAIFCSCIRPTNSTPYD